MAISDRITSIEEHLKESYQELEGIGIDTTGVNNNLENIPKLLDGYWETLPKVTDEGTSITLDNTKEGKMKVLLKGNTSQDSTTGINLLQTNLTFIKNNNINGTWSGNTYSYNGMTFTYNENGTITISGTSNSSSTTYFYLAENISLSAGDYTRVCYNKGQATGTPTLQTRINNIGGSDMFNSGSAGLRTATITETTVLVARLGVPANAVTNTTVYPMIVSGTYTNSTIPEYEQATGGIPSPNPSYPQPIHVVSGNNTITIANSDNTQSKSYSVNLGAMELCKIGTYQDYIYKENNKWYKYVAIGKVVLNGSETWNGNANGFYHQENTLKRVQNYTDYIMCNNLQIATQNSGMGYGKITGYYSSGGNYPGENWFYVRIENITSSSDLQTWLSTHNTTVYYVLATPTYTKIEGTLASQLEALNGAKSYTPQTNISQNNNDLASVLNATALSNGTVTPSLQGVQTLSLGQNVDLQTQEPIEETIEEQDEQLVIDTNTLENV